MSKVCLVAVYGIAGIFQGVKFSWVLGFVVICGKTFVVGSDLNARVRYGLLFRCESCGTKLPPV